MNARRAKPIANPRSAEEISSSERLREVKTTHEGRPDEAMPRKPDGPDDRRQTHRDHEKDRQGVRRTRVSIWDSRMSGPKHSLSQALSLDSDLSDTRCVQAGLIIVEDQGIRLGKFPGRKGGLSASAGGPPLFCQLHALPCGAGQLPWKSTQTSRCRGPSNSQK